MPPMKQLVSVNRCSLYYVKRKGEILGELGDLTIAVQLSLCNVLQRPSHEVPFADRLHSALK